MKRIIAMFLGWAISLSPAFAGETIKWGVYDWPPMHIIEGEHKGKGIFDSIMYHFQKKLPEYTHDTVTANTARFWSYIKDGENFIYISSIVTPERLKYAYFSMPDAIVIANTVVMRKETADSLKIADSVSLNSLLKNKELKGGLIADRSYGKDNDKIIADNMNDANLYFQRVGNLGFSLFQMLLAKRVDYIVEYSYVAIYFEEILNKKGETVSIRIEDASPYQLAYVACPRNEWGRRMIDRINTIIKEARPTEEYRKIMEMWQSEDGKKTIRKAYDEIFMKTAEVNE